MKTILVTGATGCIGSNLVIELIKQGYSVRAFHRETSNTLTLKGIDVEHCLGDTRNKESLQKAMHGCDTVFHAAAIVSFWKKRRAEQLEVNVGGTRNVVELCLELGIEKLVHTSSVATLGHRTDEQLVDETTPYNWGTAETYKYSKHCAEQEIQKGIQQGLNATIVNPSVIIGPRDVYAHGGQIVRDIKRGRIPVYIDGGINVVSVHDVVRGHIAAAAKGRKAERYILGGTNCSYKELFDRAAKVLGGKSPSIKAPIRLAKALGHIFDVIGSFSSKEPWVTSELLANIGINLWYSIEKAQLELDYSVSSIDDAMQEAYEWYRGNGMM